MYLIGLHYHQDKPRWTLRSLVSHIGLPVTPVIEVLHAQEDREILLLMKEDMTYLPAKDIDTLTVREMLLAIQQQLMSDKMFENDPCAMQVISRLLDRFDESIMQAFSGETVKSLISAPDPAACDTKLHQTVSKG